MYIILSNVLQNALCTILCTGGALAAKQIRCQSLMLSFTSNHHLRNTDERDDLGNALLECEKYIYQKLRNIVYRIREIYFTESSQMQSFFSAAKL